MLGSERYLRDIYAWNHLNGNVTLSYPFFVENGWSKNDHECKSVETGKMACGLHLVRITKSFSSVIYHFFS